jgi:hypothetical protein
MKEDIETFTVKVTNKLTGEISEHEIKTSWDAKELYLQLSASETAIKNAKKQLASFLNEWLGQEEMYKFVDGKVLKRVQRESRTWTTMGLREVGVDNDSIETMSKVNMTLAKQIIDEMIERGDIRPDAKKLLLASADVSVSAPFVEIR